MKFLPFALLALAAAVAGAAPPHPSTAPLASGFGTLAEGPEDEITPADRALIWRDIDRQLSRLMLPKSGHRPGFAWPLRVAKGYSQPGLERIANYFDHDSAYPGQVRDYNCGRRTYDRDNGYNHQGIDFSIWPDNWNTMASGQLEIVAAAPGTIVLKDDGNFDQNCAFGSGRWNAVYVQHDDGSIAWYGHMKSGSLTSRAVGERVATGEYLGAVGSSGNSTGPHLHFEVYDAGRRLIDPYAGRCNTRNTESWWAEQPPYAATRVNRVITASAAPVFGTCGGDGRMQTPGSLAVKGDFAPGETAYFVAFVRDQEPGQAVVFTVRRPDGSIWRTATGSGASDFFSGAYWWVSYTLPAAEPAGTWTFEAQLGAARSAVPFTLTPGAQGVANYTDLWWNPSEPGWGVNLSHQGTTLFATWFTYDADGSGMWLVMPEAIGTGASMSGTIYRATGTPLQQINNAPAANFPLPAVGTASLTFAGRDRATFEYTLNGVRQAKPLQRQRFSTPTRCVESRSTRAHATNYQDLWWNPSESGWGLNLTHQGEVIFATWFTYGAGGQGQWLVGSDVRRQPTGEYRGRLYRTTGQPFDRINSASALAGATDVGQLTLTFPDGERGRMDYTVDGFTQSKSIVRQAFGATRPLCE